MRPLYECSVCGQPVTVIKQGDGVEPIKKFSCEHTTAVIYCNVQMVAVGQGEFSTGGKVSRFIRAFKDSISRMISEKTNKSFIWR